MRSRRTCFWLEARQASSTVTEIQPRPTMRLAIVFVIAASAVPAFAQVQPGTYIFTTVAGRAALAGTTDGVGTNARFNRPFGITVNSTGELFVSDSTNHTVRKIAVDGTVTTLAGQAGVVGIVDGVGTAARFGGDTTYANATVAAATNPTGPFGIALLPGGNVLVADSSYHVIRQISAAREVSNFAGTVRQKGTTDGARATALFGFPLGVAVDATGAIFVADSETHVIRRISPTGAVTTIAGVPNAYGDSDGVAEGARFLHPSAIAVSPGGNVYVVDCNNTVRKLSRFGGSQDVWETKTLAGAPHTFGTTDGTGAAARFGAAPSTAVSTILIRGSVIPQNEFLFILTGGANYSFADLVGIAADAADNVYVCDYANSIIRKITPAGVVTTIGGLAPSTGSVDGAGTAARFSRPAGIAVDADGAIYITDNGNNTIRKGVPAAVPVIRTQPADQTVALGSNVVLSLSVTGAPAPIFQWTRNGAVVPGVTGSTLTLNNVQAANSGTYSVTVSNILGVISTTPFVLNVTALPVFTTQPASQTTINGGETIRLTAAATGAPVPTYQWFRDGQLFAGATSATLTITNAQSTSAGDYTVVATNTFGSVTSNVARVTVNVGRIINLSIRTALTGSDALIVGFVAAGGSKSMLIRAVGPTLRDFGLTTAMADPQLSLFAGATLSSSNDNWGTGASAVQLPAASAAVGAFALAAGSLDAAILANVEQGMTAQASARNGAGGIVLVELYDAAPSSPARLINVSARTRVGTGDNILIAGFVIGGTSSKSVLIRAIGPSLTAFGVTGVLANPRLDIFAAGSTAVRVSNDNWAGATALVNAFTSVGAFPLPLGASLDAALVTTLPPGGYSAQVSGVGNTTGEALLEIYELP
jgi:sugar lactone lactonase YvrE